MAVEETRSRMLFDINTMNKVKGSHTVTIYIVAPSYDYRAGTDVGVKRNATDCSDYH